MQKNYFLIILALATTICHTSDRDTLTISCQQFIKANKKSANTSFNLSCRYAELLEAAADLLLEFHNPNVDINVFSQFIPENLQPLVLARWQENHHPSNPTVRSLILQNTKKIPDYNGYILAKDTPHLKAQQKILQAKNKELKNDIRIIKSRANRLLYETFNQARLFNTARNHPLTHAQILNLIDNPWLKYAVAKEWNKYLSGNFQTPFCQNFLNNIPTSSESDSPTRLEIEKPASPKLDDLDNLFDTQFLNNTSSDDNPETL
jgi:hypothetical protein